MTSTTTNTLRQPIVTVAGHVDHGKTSILDAFRGTSVQEGEAGGITQKISFTRYPKEQLIKSCPLIKQANIELKIPGFLFIDTPGHAAFTHLRKRGGALADLAILVVSIKEGIKPQTAEVISLLKANKTPFVIALNKIDTISGWKTKTHNQSLKESIESQASNVREEFETALLTFQGSLQAHVLDSDLFYELNDFTKKVAIVPCSAKTKEGIPELLFVLSGLSQKFLAKQLELGEDAKGVILEIKKSKTEEQLEAILYDGVLKEGDEIAIATLNKTITSKVKAIHQIDPLSFKYSSTKEVKAATGLRLKLGESENLIPGMPFQKINNNFKQIAEEFKKEILEGIKTDKTGIIVKADSLGSLEALLTLLKQANVQVVKASIGNISKADIAAAKANLDINELDAVILGFNVETEENLELDTKSNTDKEKLGIKILLDKVVYKLIENLQEWRNKKQSEIEKSRLMGLATICKLEILHKFVFRNSNPAIFGVRVLAGKLKSNIPLINNQDENIAHVKAIQSEKRSVGEAPQGSEIALSLPGVTFDRQLKETHYLYANISEKQFKEFKKHKDLLSADELKVLQEISLIKQKKKQDWGI